MAGGVGGGGQEVAEDVEGDGEHDGRVVLRGDAAEGLQVPQLQHKQGSVGRSLFSKNPSIFIGIIRIWVWVTNRNFMV